MPPAGQDWFETYPPPVADWLKYETQFKINVTKGSDTSASTRDSGSPSYVYLSAAPADAPAEQQGKTLYYTVFSFQGKATVWVQDLSQQIVASTCTR